MVNAILNIRSGLKRNGKTCYKYDLSNEVITMGGTMLTYNQPSTSSMAISILGESKDDWDFVF